MLSSRLLNCRWKDSKICVWARHRHWERFRLSHGDQLKIHIWAWFTNEFCCYEFCRLAVTQDQIDSSFHSLIGRRAKYLLLICSQVISHRAHTLLELVVSIISRFQIAKDLVKEWQRTTIVLWHGLHSQSVSADIGLDRSHVHAGHLRHEFPVDIWRSISNINSEGFTELRAYCR